MSNEHYLIVSYFVAGFVSLGVGLTAYRLLRAPFAVIAERVSGKSRGLILIRTLATSLAVAALLGFLSVDYKACLTYEQVVKDRDYLVEMNHRQLERAGNWTAGAVLVWGFVVVIGLVALRKNASAEERKE